MLTMPSSMLDMLCVLLSRGYAGSTIRGEGREMEEVSASTSEDREARANIPTACVEESDSRVTCVMPATCSLLVRSLAAVAANCITSMNDRRVTPRAGRGRALDDE